MKWSNFLFVVRFSEAQLNSSVFLDKYHSRWKLWGCVYKSFVWPSLLWRSGSIFWGTLKRCDEVDAACAGFQLGMAGIVRCLDRLQSAFWSCWGQTLVSPPCVSYITSTNTSKQAGLEINLSSGQRFLPVSVDSWHNQFYNFIYIRGRFLRLCKETFLSFLGSLSSCILSSLKQCEC